MERILGAWRGEPVAHLRGEGDDASGTPVVLAPLPHQRPHPPVWVAAFGPKALAQAGSLDSDREATSLQGPAQRLRTLEQYAVYPQRAGGVDILLHIVHEDAGVGPHIERVESCLVGRGRRLAHAGLAGDEAPLEATSTISAKTHRHRCDRSIFEGFKVKGLPSHVVVNGRIQYADGDLKVERGAGQFLQRSLR